MNISNWLLYFFISSVTGSPLLGLLVLAALWYGGSGWYFGRLSTPFGPLKERLRIRRLRGELSVNPHNVNVRAELGGLLATRSPDEAKKLLQEVCQRAPELPLPHYYLGLALLALGDTAAGRASIERALAIRPDLRYGEPWVRLGDHYASRGQGAEAIAAYRKATAAHTSYAEAWYKLGAALKRAGDRDAGREALQETLQSTEHAPAFKRRVDRSWRWRAWWALRQG